MQTNATFSVVISTKNRWRAPKLAIDRSLKFPCCRLVIMTMRVFIRNIAGGDSNNVVLQGVLYLASPACPSVPVMSGHLQCTDTFAWSRGCPFITGTTVVSILDIKKFIQSISLFTVDNGDIYNQNTILSSTHNNDQNWHVFKYPWTRTYALTQCLCKYGDTMSCNRVTPNDMATYTVALLFYPFFIARSHSEIERHNDLYQYFIESN